VSIPGRPQRVVCIIPAFDEAGKIGGVLARFPPAAVDEIVVIDDGSADATATVAREGGAVVLSHPTRRGLGAAVRKGLEYARERQFDVIAVMAGDAQDDPAELPALLAPVLSGEADLVQGSRRAGGLRAPDMPAHRRVLTRLYTHCFSCAAARRVTDATNGYRVLRAEVLHDARIDLRQRWLDGYELEPYVLLKALRLGYRVQEVPVVKRYHLDLGYTKMSGARDWWSLFRPVVLLGLRMRS
jgi:dolichol-phosphate mannosyltransferase